MPTLFQMGADLLAVYEQIDDHGGELPPELEKWFDELHTNEAAKLDSYVGLIRQADAEAAAATEEAERWKMRAQARTNLSKRLKERIKQHMELTGRAKVETATGRVLAIQKNGGLMPLKQDDVTPDSVPTEYLMPVIDWGKVRKALEGGTELTFARLEPRGTHLRIK